MTRVSAWTSNTNRYFIPSNSVDSCPDFRILIFSYYLNFPFLLVTLILDISLIYFHSLRFLPSLVWHWAYVALDLCLIYSSPQNRQTNARKTISVMMWKPTVLQTIWGSRINDLLKSIFQLNPIFAFHIVDIVIIWQHSNGGDAVDIIKAKVTYSCYYIWC